MNKDENILKDLSVLYVEDENNTRQSMERILNKFFKKVCTYEDGDKGLEGFKKQYDTNEPIDIIITDINMPVMNGIDMIRHIRSYDENIPIVLITAHSEANYLLDAINLGVTQYVVKPVNTMLLFENLKKAYLPIYQKKLLEEKNKELEELNKKIKEVAKQELENMRYKDIYLSNDDIDFGEFLDNITIDD